MPEELSVSLFVSAPSLRAHGTSHFRAAALNKRRELNIIIATGSPVSLFRGLITFCLKARHKYATVTLHFIYDTLAPC